MTSWAPISPSHEERVHEHEMRTLHEHFGAALQPQASLSLGSGSWPRPLVREEGELLLQYQRQQYQRPTCWMMVGLVWRPVKLESSVSSAGAFMRIRSCASTRKHAPRKARHRATSAKAARHGGVALYNATPKMRVLASCSGPRLAAKAHDRACLHLPQREQYDTQAAASPRVRVAASLITVAPDPVQYRHGSSPSRACIDGLGVEPQCNFRSSCLLCEDSRRSPSKL